MELNDRIALVTGGATGLGADVCRLLVGVGARVAVNYSRSADAAQALCHELGAEHAFPIQADVRDEAAVAAMVAETTRRFGGPIDLLVNNAGITTYAAPGDMAVTGEDWERILGVNLVGTWNCIRAVAPAMGCGGAIVNVASDAAFSLDGSSLPYVVSKVGVVALTRALAEALAPDVRVNAVAPGWMDTPWLDRYVPEDALVQLRAGGEPMVPVDKVAREVVRLLADDRATGEVTQLSA
jgi:3-oxoacyl-[acyl-carrier protein] reductase